MYKRNEPELLNEVLWDGIDLSRVSLNCVRAIKYKLIGLQNKGLIMEASNDVMNEIFNRLAIIEDLAEGCSSSFYHLKNQLTAEHMIRETEREDD